jgi:multiple sugar transport system substrate-binding protein
MKNLGQINGAFKLYPYTGSVGGIGVNRGILDQVGEKYPDDGVYTQADFERICAKVVIPNQRWCVAGQVANPTLEPLGFFWAGGAQYLNPDRSKVVINSPAGVDVLNWMLSLKQKGYWYPGETTAQYSDDATALRQGKVAFAVGYGYISTKDYMDTLGPAVAGYNFDILPYPQKQGVVNGGMSFNPSGFSVTKQSDPNKLAWIAAFLDYLLSPDYMTQYEVAGSGVPVVQNPPNATGRLADLMNKQAGWINHFGLNDEGFAAHNFSKLVTDFFPEIQAAFLGSKTAQQALDDYTTKGNADLAAP